MGREILYCEICSNRILDTDHFQKQSEIVGEKVYCESCQPRNSTSSSTQLPRPATRRKKISSRSLPRVSSHKQPTTRRRLLIAKKKSSAPFIIGICAGAILLVVLLVVIAGTPSSSLSDQKKDSANVDNRDEIREAHARTALADLKLYRLEQADNPDMIARRCRDVMPKVLGTSFEEDVRIILRDAEQSTARLDQ